jgi:hypothetical protein
MVVIAYYIACFDGRVLSVTLMAAERRLGYGKIERICF